MAVHAIKGLGGFHLACTATVERVVARLRRRKHRFDKPFALMARDHAMIRRYCHIDQSEWAALRGAQSPIVVLRASGLERLAPSVAPGQSTYGFLLPYTPLHQLLMDGMRSPIVLTSANVSDEPQCIHNREALERLDGIADYFLLHDRDIVNRLDDSVERVVAGRPRLLRRARGYAPAPVPLPRGFERPPRVLALGAELKNTFCLLRDGQAVVSQHLGDLENPAAFTAFRSSLELYRRLYDHKPTVLAVDLHPDYLSTKLGHDWAASEDLELVEVQHHHAHIAACLAENGVPLDAPPVLGVALDGLGFGADGSLWGGEFLLADYRGFRRLATFESAPMPGGVQAIREPWRMAFAYLRQAFEWDALMAEYAGLPFFESMRHKPLRTLEAMIDKGVNSPYTSACGRLFDAVSAILGLRQEVTYEGQAAIELEVAADPAALRAAHGAYTFDVAPRNGEVAFGIELRSMWQGLLHDLTRGIPSGIISARFHRGLARAIADMVATLNERHRDPWGDRVALVQCGRHRAGSRRRSRGPASRSRRLYV